VPERGGDTTWASGYASYDALSPALKARIAGLRAVHRHPRPQQNPPVPAVHPVVRPHAVTGRPVLYVSPQFTTRIEGLDEEEGGALLKELLDHVTNPRFAWTHQWRVGDLVMWDNRCTMHRRDSFDASARRVMKRTQMLEDAPAGAPTVMKY
jgi:taurine dioxygenase